MEQYKLTTWHQYSGRNLTAPRIGQLKLFLTKGGGQKKRCQHCLNPNSSEHVLFFRAIQGHSGGTLVDPSLQDNVLLPDGFAEYIHHVVNAHDMHSIIQCGLIPGGKSQERKANSVFFTAVNPMYTSTTWINPELQCTTILGNFYKIQ